MPLRLLLEISDTEPCPEVTHAGDWDTLGHFANVGIKTYMYTKTVDTACRDQIDTGPRSLTATATLQHEARHAQQCSRQVLRRIARQVVGIVVGKLPR